jgi:stearoyl-CoA desaturase (delta-9 desaturase)
MNLTHISKSFWFQFVPAIGLGITTIILLCTGVIAPHYLWATLVGWILVCGLGIAVGYHRVFSHRTHQLPPWKENVIQFLAVFAGQGASIFWVALHRGYHHRLSDHAGDIHSPTVYGVYQAFVGWQRDITESTNTVSMKYAVDLLRKPNHVWFHKHHLKILWLVPITIALIDWQLALCGFWLVTMIGVLQDNTINVLGHLKAGIGYRNFDTDDNSQNNIILGYLGWGQGWHNNHHHAPASYDFGSGVSGRWWEWDPCRIFLPLLR